MGREAAQVSRNGRGTRPKVCVFRHVLQIGPMEHNSALTRPSFA